MKIYLASFQEPQNFGPGDIVGICRSKPPATIKCFGIIEELTPSVELLETYQRNKFADKNSGIIFQQGFEAQLEKFITELEEQAQQENCEVTELLPFEDGDTLASWERSDHANYRKTLVPYLERMGYEVICN